MAAGWVKEQHSKKFVRSCLCYHDLCDEHVSPTSEILLKARRAAIYCYAGLLAERGPDFQEAALGLSKCGVQTLLPRAWKWWHAAGSKVESPAALQPPQRPSCTSSWRCLPLAPLLTRLGFLRAGSGHGAGAASFPLIEPPVDFVPRSQQGASTGWNAPPASSPLEIDRDAAADLSRRCCRSFGRRESRSVHCSIQVVLPGWPSPMKQRADGV